ncbi:MAG: hypothetical protein LBR72_06325 [Oscillospiraceae bacterium]|jgi:hypothetical protein|nr:hypothetical protein [Oscillospiraceae bacterium]
MRLKYVLAAALAALLLLTAGCTRQNASPSPQPIPPAASPAESPKDPKAEAYAAYTSAMDMLSTSPESGNTQFDMDMTMDMNMTMMGQSILMSVGGNIKAVVEGDKTLYSSVMETDMFGTKSKVETVYDGEKIYYAVDGVETEMTLPELQAQMGQDANMPEFDVSAIKSFETVELPDGGKKTIFILDGEKMTAFLTKAMGSGLAQLGGTMNIGDTTADFVTSSTGDPKTLGLKLPMKMTAEEQEIASVDMNMLITVNKFGSGVVVDTSKASAA